MSTLNAAAAVGSISSFQLQAVQAGAGWSCAAGSDSTLSLSLIGQMFKHILVHDWSSDAATDTAQWNYIFLSIFSSILEV